MKAIFLSCLCFCIIGIDTYIYAQDVSQLAKTNPLQISGSLRLSSNFYQATGDRDLLAPFNYSIGANVNLTAYNVSFPVSFYYTDGNSQFSRAFNIAGASPYYKWIKLHLGDRSMRFSPYVMSRRNFFGVGLELTPGDFNISYLRGKLRNLYARQDTLSSATIVLPEFDRRINGAKLAYRAGVFGIDINAIKVKDDLSSLPDNYKELTSVIPQENIVGSIGIRATLFKRLVIQANGASSILTQDLSSQTIPDMTGILRAFSGVIEPNISTRISFAKDASINYRFKRFGIGASWKQIDPFYRSLAAAYFQNDITNITGNVNFALLKNRWTFKTRLGFQEDNVKNDRAYTNRRLIGSVVTSIIPNKKLFATIQYSNFQRENMSGIVELNDTLRYVSYSGNLLANVRYRLEKENVDYTFQIGGFSQTIRDESPLFTIDQDITNYSANAQIRVGLKRSKLTIAPGINYGIFEFPDFIQTRYGGQINVNKPLLNGVLTSSFTSRFDFNDVDEFRDGYTWKNRASLNITLKERHRIRVSASFLERDVVTQSSFQEYRLLANYVFRII